MKRYKHVLQKYRIVFVVLVLGIVFVSFDKPEQIDPKADYFRAGQDAWKKKDIPLAVKNARLSFFQKPDSYRLYWYMYFLSLDKNYDETIAVLEQTPKEVWHPCKYETYIYRYYAEALKNKGRRTDAVAVLIEALDKKDISSERNLIPLIHYWFAYPNLVTQFKAHPRYESIMRDMISLMSKNWKNVDAANREILYNFCIINAACEIKNEHNGLADLYISTRR